MPIDGGDGTASVTLSTEETAAASKMALRTKSDPGSNPITGADLGAGPGAGRTTDGDRGGASDITKAAASAEANAAS